MNSVLEPWRKVMKTPTATIYDPSPRVCKDSFSTERQQVCDDVILSSECLSVQEFAMEETLVERVVNGEVSVVMKW